MAGATVKSSSSTIPSAANTFSKRNEPVKLDGIVKSFLPCPLNTVNRPLPGVAMTNE